MLEKGRGGRGLGGGNEQWGRFMADVKLDQVHGFMCGLMWSSKSHMGFLLKYLSLISDDKLNFFSHLNNERPFGLCKSGRMDNHSLSHFI